MPSDATDIHRPYVADELQWPSIEMLRSAEYLGFLDDRGRYKISYRR
jgi:hypothetical protein